MPSSFVKRKAVMYARKAGRKTPNKKDYALAHRFIALQTAKLTYEPRTEHQASRRAIVKRRRLPKIPGMTRQEVIGSMLTKRRQRKEMQQRVVIDELKHLVPKAAQLPGVSLSKLKHKIHEEETNLRRMHQQQVIKDLKALLSETKSMPGVSQYKIRSQIQVEEQKLKNMR